MRLVTEQGIRARAERDDATEKLSVTVLDYITAEPRTPSDIVSAFTDRQHDASMVREAIWVLLNRSRADLTPDRKVARIA